MPEPVPPVGERHVVVDADEVDVSVRPERVEVEEHGLSRTRSGILTAIRGVTAIRGMMPEVFRPVRGIADRSGGSEDAAHVRREIAERLHRGIAAWVRADRREPAHLRADQEGVDPARPGAEMGTVQDHAPQAPGAGRAGPGDGLAGDHELARARRAEEGRDLGRRSGGAVDRAGMTRRRGAGDPTPPREGRLASLARMVAVGVRQRVLRGYVHQEEGIERHPEPAGLQLADRLDDREVGGRAA
jgi:hypothetical protein